MYRHVKLQEESGQSIKGYCLKEGLSHSTFQYWRKKYLEDVEGPVGFSRLRVSEGAGARIILSHPSGYRMEFMGYSPVDLGLLLKSITHA